MPRPNSKLPANAAPVEPVEIVPVGECACLVRLGAAIHPAVTARVLSLFAALDAAPPPGVVDLVPAYASLLVRFDPLATSAAALRAALDDALALAALGMGRSRARQRVVRIPVAYGGAAGPDLEEVARLVGVAPVEVIRRHASASYTVAFLGFLAGFPYLSGLPPELAVPRLASPRTSVPEGSVALAERQAGIYSVASPGGWRVVGRTPLRLFDAQRDPPALLRPGDHVRFVPLPPIAGDTAPALRWGRRTTAASGAHDGAARRSPGASADASPYAALGAGTGAGFVRAQRAARPGLARPPRVRSTKRHNTAASDAGDERGIPWLRVIRPGPLTSVQDLGRYGYARFGVAAGGAADADALRLGNLLLGNRDGAAGLEITLGGAAFTILAPCAVALTGADCTARADGRPMRMGVVIALHPGQTLQIDTARAGLRVYLCVAGGVAVPTILGSRATDLRAGFGGLDGRPLRAGDVLARGEATLSLALLAGRRLPPDHVRRQPAAGVRTLRVLRGAQPATLHHLLAGSYMVDPRSDRMGVRLIWDGWQECGVSNGERPVGGQVLSQGVPPAAVQLPPDGQPILLLADAQTTGGYLIPAVVIAGDHWRVAQLRPGERVRFALTTEEEAVAALGARQRWLERTAQSLASGTRTPKLPLLMRGFAEWSDAADTAMGGGDGEDATT
jgi:KipI family sensor histidine kinase inhibitor